jgi:transcription-repair coupling factor (superfamily II helicase)
MLPNESVILEGLWDSPKALLASEAVKKRSVLLITQGTSEDRFFENLAYFCPGKTIEFPAWETLPGEEIAPSPDIIGKRFEALNALLSRKEPSIVLCPLASLLQKIAPKEALVKTLHKWKVGDEVSFDHLPELLTSLGFRRSPVVSDKGEFALRGGILDLFPVGSSDPYRVEFFGDVIENIKTFDPVGQKTIAKASELFLSPAKEMSYSANIADYLDDPIIFWDDLLEIEDAYVKLLAMPAAKSPYFFDLKEILKKWDKNQHIFCTQFPLQKSFEMFDHKFHAKPLKHNFFKIEHCFHEGENPDPSLRFLFLNANDTEEAEVKKQLQNIQLPKNTRFEKGYLTSGYCLDGLVVIPNVELTKRSRIRRQKWRNTYHSTASEFHELSPGDMVVHFHSGIGKFLGLEKHTNHLGTETEFLSLEYADNSKLFVPLSQSHLVSRYIGAHEAPPTLSQLGGKKWQAVRASAQAQIVGYANDLLQIYAQRAVQGGFRYNPDSALMEQFEKDFPYQETQDQTLAIQALKEDMISEKAMDRLICGDVGYGKTEVAMRAAFKAVVDGHKQVAVLVPTTVLATQHYESFVKRMSGFPVQIGIISRFQSAKQIKETLAKIKTGEIDIVIGTHRVLSKDVGFKDLGLIIIDEEQRFGVKAKEHLKKFKAGADCLTLSATPIPRTLYMSLVHARDMSVISTPPQDRLPVKTIIAETDPELMQNALLRELSRGGQAFFIHNRVESIHTKADMIQKLVPNAKIGIVHGQMDPDAVDEIFHKFKQQELDILFATTIIENGIDVSNANTILIDQANTYGLADLYQLRGRVGRWNRAAYAYFLIPKHHSLPEPARKRLNALVEASGYGGGMKLAMRDLEIRGAGDILGLQQSGQVSAVGFHLYCKMLKRAIDALKKEVPISFNETKMEFHYDAKLSENYINEVSLRMEIYYRLGEAVTFTDVDALLSEMKDRFGTPPESVIWLYHLTRIRVFATANHFSLLKFSQMSLLAEQQKGKEIKKQTILLPKKVQKPKELEEYVIGELKKYFICERSV